MRYEVSYVDMHDIFEALFYKYKMYEFPQIMVFKELEGGGNILRYVFDDGRSIIYLKKDDRMLDTLIKELKECTAPKRPAFE